MKILMVHNFYGSAAPSGENAAFLAERRLFRSRGVEVVEFTRHSDEIRNRGCVGTVQGAFSTVWNPFSASNLRLLIEKTQPDVMHVHNTFPLLSPAVFHAVKGFPVATVLTLHNYRLFCAAGVPERNGVPCTECLECRSVLPAMRYGCYRHNRLATLPLAAMIAFHRGIGTWRSHVDAFIALTDFQRDILVTAGLPEKKVFVKPHFYADPPTPLPWQERRPKVLYVGRLGEYKGVRILVDAWRKWGSEAPLLEIIGEGPESGRLKKMIEGGWPDKRITFTGQIPFSEVQARLAGARLLVLPSLCFEGFPMVIREAFALGVPVAASRIGSIPGIVEDGKTGVLFRPGDTDELLARVKTLWGQADNMAEMGKAARTEFEHKYTADINYRRLIAIYAEAQCRQQTG